MRAILLALIVLTAALAGCAEGTEPATEGTDATDADAGAGTEDTQQEAEDAGEAAGETTDEALATFTATLGLPEGELTAGTAFNVTLDSDLAEGDAANATWTLDVLAGNDTIDSQSGTGVPAVVELTLADAGNYTLAGAIQADGYQDASLEGALSILAGAAEELVTFPAPILWKGDTGAITFLCDPSGDGDEVGSDGYHYFTPSEIAGWSFQLLPDDGSINTVWWAGADTSERGGSSGTVPSGRDNVGVCPEGDMSYIEHNVERTEYTLTLYPPGHPDAPA